jgi:hypothetical protein
MDGDGTVEQDDCDRLGDMFPGPPGPKAGEGRCTS